MPDTKTMIKLTMMMPFAADITKAGMKMITDMVESISIPVEPALRLTFDSVRMEHNRLRATLTTIMMVVMTVRSGDTLNEFALEIIKMTTMTKVTTEAKILRKLAVISMPDLLDIKAP